MGIIYHAYGVWPPPFCVDFLIFYLYYMAWSLTWNILPVLNILFLSCSYFHKVNPEFQSELQGKKGPGGEMISLLHISVLFF